jgi:hypothetical protein
MIKTSNFKILWHACTSRNQLLWKIWILIFFAKKRLFQIKTAITFAYGFEKTYNIWKTIYIKFYIRFQQPVCTISCFSKFQREIWKQEDFRFCQKKWEKMIFFQIFSFLLLFLLLFGYFEVFLLILEFWNFLSFLIFFEYFEFKNY